MSASTDHRIGSVRGSHPGERRLEPGIAAHQPPHWLIFVEDAHRIGFRDLLQPLLSAIHGR